ncbi:MAG TPA: hypothetical protein VN436_07965 [Holophaga sp.]|nr:hypothetical protein [Holophaga sp.]
MDINYNRFTTAITSMVQEAQRVPRNLLKSWDEMEAAPDAAEAFNALPEDDPKTNQILKACCGQFEPMVGDWLKKKRTKKTASSNTGHQGKA